VERLVERPWVGAVSCHHEIAREAGGPAVPYLGPTTCTAEELLWDNFLGSTTFCMWRRDVLSREPRFDATVRYGEDWDVWIQCAEQAAVDVVPEVLCRYVAHAGARLTDASLAQAEGRRRIVHKYSDRMSSGCRRYNVARATILEGPPPIGEARSLARLLGTGDLRVARVVVSSSLAGRVGNRAGDPARGSRRLHELVARLA
jgi:hypothetical protein